MPCNFNEYFCDGIPLTVLLTICPEGHIRESYLCPDHHSAYMGFLKGMRLNCMKCHATMTLEWLQERL